MIALPFLLSPPPSAASARPPSAGWRRWCALLLALAVSLPATAQFRAGAISAQTPALTTATPKRQGGDYIVAVVNQELVTNSEVQQRLSRVVRESGSKLSSAAQEDLQRRVLDQLIDERAQISYARETGLRVDESELDRAVSNIAAQNQLGLVELRDRLRQEGLDYGRFRSSLRDQILLERVREREVQSRIRVSDRDIENWLVQERLRSGLTNQYNVAQILIRLPETPTPADVAARRARAIDVLQRLRAGADFATLVHEVSDGPKEQGGQLGLKPASKLPDIFVEAIESLRPGEVAPQVLRSGAGFHIVKLIERQDAALVVQQHHARHILLRPGPQLSAEQAARRLAAMRRDIVAGKARFEDLARRYSEDGSAAGGGDLSWASPGQFVPEFEQAMQVLQPGEVSEPLVSRFGVHLIQLIERRAVPLDARQQRESARAALREQKYEEAYTEWARDVRARAFVELREVPQS